MMFSQEWKQDRDGGSQRVRESITRQELGWAAGPDV